MARNQMALFANAHWKKPGSFTPEDFFKLDSDEPEEALKIDPKDLMKTLSTRFKKR